MPLKILLADDSMTAQNMGKKILTEAGYQVVAVSNGAAAVKKIAAQPLDIIIVDIFMPGYSGIEVCERVKNAPATAKIPVLLTVGKMEPYKPEDGHKAKADGVIVKPFEATDLVAVVKKLEEKLAAALSDQTVKMAAPAFAHESKNASYEEWKVAAPPEEDTGPARINVPQEMQSSPAIGFDDENLGVPTLPATSAPADFEETINLGGLAQPPGFSDTQPIEPIVEATPSAHTTQPIEPIVEATPRPSPTASAGDKIVIVDQASETAEIEAVPGPEPEIEFTSAPKIEVISEPASGLEPTIAPKHEVEVTPDPALVTDASEMVSAFPTRFGVDNPEIIPVGVASDLESDAQLDPPQIVEADNVAEPATTAIQLSVPGNLEAEMTHAFVDETVSITAPAHTTPALAQAAAASAGGATGAAVSSPQNSELSAALEAAVSVSPPPGTSSTAVAQVVARVLERMKPDLVAEIERELEQARRKS